MGGTLDASDADAPSYRGFVLLDNTTVFGARNAFEWDPVRPRELPSGVNLRSLMDVLEAIVLFNDFAVDNSSREYFAWPHLNHVSEAAGSFFHDTAVLIDSYALPTAITEISTAQLSHLLDSGQLVAQLGFMPSSRELDVLPPFYRDTDEFMRLAYNGVYRRSPEGAAAGARLRALAVSLERQHPSVRNFAYFAFRGFYYQQLAHLMSASYMPHSWRSGLIRSQIDRPVVKFGDLVLDETASIRAALSERINNEFGAAALSAEFPLIASYVIGQCSTRRSLLTTAVEIRRTAKATAFRNWIYAIEEKLRNQHDLVAIRTAQEELRTVVRELEQELGLTRREKQEVVVKLGIPLASAETTTHVPTVKPWLSRLFRRRTHLVFLRDLARESTRLTPFATAFRQLAP
ncbi:hypothetical protein [Streptomyces sp. NPDC020917]|uniref:hypothetical protein n=1 Tax=Streptomyces sp. NPDC020917 TaxID=3365102 RepID=UPI0037B1A00E